MYRWPSTVITTYILPVLQARKWLTVANGMATRHATQLRAVQKVGHRILTWAETLIVCIGSSLGECGHFCAKMDKNFYRWIPVKTLKLNIFLYALNCFDWSWHCYLAFLSSLIKISLPWDRVLSIMIFVCSLLYNMVMWGNFHNSQKRSWWIFCLEEVSGN